MRSHTIVGTLLAGALLVGCGDRAPESTQDTEQNALEAAPDQAAAPGEEALQGPPVAVAPGTSSTADGSAAGNRRVESPAPRATASSAAPSASTPAPSTASPAQSATPSPAQPAIEWRELTVPANTALPLELMGALSSETAQVETSVRARLRQAVLVDGYTVLPAGAVLTGNVTEVQRAGRVQGRSRLVFRFTEVQIDGTSHALRTNPIVFEGEATRGEDAAKIGAGAVGGAIIGGILGGGDGAAKGAAIGGAAGTGAVLATRGREVELASGTQIPATLAVPYSTEVEVK